MCLISSPIPVPSPSTQPMAAPGQPRPSISQKHTRPGHKRIFTLNELNGPQHEFIQADAVDWIAQASHWPKRYDVIVLDPPTFSNSKRSQTVLDLKRDHGELIRAVLNLLTPRGSCSFQPMRAVLKWTMVCQNGRQSVKRHATPHHQISPRHPIDLGDWSSNETTFELGQPV